MSGGGGQRKFFFLLHFFFHLESLTEAGASLPVDGLDQVAERGVGRAAGVLGDEAGDGGVRVEVAEGRLRVAAVSNAGREFFRGFFFRYFFL